MVLGISWASRGYAQGFNHDLMETPSLIHLMAIHMYYGVPRALVENTAKKNRNHFSIAVLLTTLV